LPKEAAHKATWALPNSSVLVDPMCSDFAERCKIKGTMRSRIASKRTVGGSVLLAAELSKPVADKQGRRRTPMTNHYACLAGTTLLALFGIKSSATDSKHVLSHQRLVGTFGGSLWTSSGHSSSISSRISSETSERHSVSSRNLCSRSKSSRTII
jgi:hypothetical protein